MPSFNTANGVIHYEIFDADGRLPGETPGLVLLHNFMSSGRSAWGPLLDGLSRDYRILLPDLPGHGRSAGYPEGFDHGIIARQLAALMHAEGMANAHLAGCSSGGMIAQLLVYHRLVDPASLTLVSTTYSNCPDVLGAPKLVPEHFDANPAWLEATARLHDPHHYDGYYADELLPGFRHLRPKTTIDLSLNALASWSLPVCLIHGQRDEFFPVRIAQEMATTLPDAVLHVAPQQSHALIFRQPWQVLQWMESFLQEQ